MNEHNHHLLFTKRAWDAQTASKELRRNSGLVIPMPDAAHMALHNAISLVPVLDHYSAETVRQRFVAGDDPLKNVDSLLFVIEGVARSRPRQSLERQLAELTMFAIDLQRPFIKDSL